MPPEISRSTHRAGRRFVRLLYGTIAILVVLAGTLTAANLAQGPQLTSAETNLPGYIARSGQRLLLTADQPLASVDAKQVTVEPKTDATATVSGSAITVQFTDILRYNTRYTVKVDGVEGTSHDATSTLEYSFTTPDVRVYSLERDEHRDDAGVKLPDAIRRTTLEGRGDGEVVFEAKRIQEYVALPGALGVVTLGDDDTTSLEILSLSGKERLQVRVPLPTPGRVENLHTSASKNLIGYTFTSAPGTAGRQYRNTPFVHDLTDPSGIPQEVTGFDGAPMAVVDLAFVPDTTSLVLQEEDQSLFLFDVLGESALTPLGQHAEMRGFIPGTRNLIVADPTQGSTIDLTDGSTTTLDLAPSALSDTAYPGKLALLDEHGRYAQLFKREAGAGLLTSAITLTDRTGSDIVYAPASDSSRIRDFCASPNGQLLAVETISAEGRSDAYPNLPASSSMTTVFVDLATGTSTRSVSGFLPDWCR